MAGRPEVPGLESPLAAAIRFRAARRPDAPFIRDRDAAGEFRVVTNGEFARAVRALRRWMRSRAAPGDLVPIAAARSADVVAAIVSGISEGLLVAPINPRLRGPNILEILERARPAALLADGMVLHGLIRSGRDPTLLDEMPVGLLNAHRVLPFQKRAYKSRLGDLPPVLADDDVEGARHVDGSAARAKRDAGSRASARPELPVDGARWDPESNGLCLFTSGSTGLPKGVMISNSDIAQRAEAEIELFGLTEEDVLLGLLPFSFDVGCNQMMTSVMSGASLVILDSWLPADIARTAAVFGVTGISCVPSIWRDFLSAGIRLDLEEGHRWLRYVTVSGGDLGVEEITQLDEIIGEAGVFKTYGQTEAFRLTCLRPSELKMRPSSVGRPFGSARIGVVRSDLTPVGPGGEGELVLAGLGAMSGYLGGEGNDEKLVPNPFRVEPGDAMVAVRTGDFGYLDEEGYLFLLGRRDLMIKIGGNRVYPEEVSRTLASAPDVADAAVVGVHREDGDALLVAFVVLSDEGTESGLRREMRRLLPPYMVPELVIRASEIPQTPGGKPDLGLLSRRAARAVSEAEGARGTSRDRSRIELRTDESEGLA